MSDLAVAVGLIVVAYYSFGPKRSGLHNQPTNFFAETGNAPARWESLAWSSPEVWQRAQTNDSVGKVPDFQGIIDESIYTY